MKYFLPFLLLLASCASHRLVTVPAKLPAVAVAKPDTARLAPASNTVVTSHRTLLDKVLGRAPESKTYAGVPAIKAGKKSTITINKVAGNQNNQQVGKKAQAQGEGATSTTIGKAKGTTATGEGNATDQAKSAQAAAVNGNENDLKQEMPPPPPKQSLWERIRWPLAGALGTAAVVAGGIMLLWPTSQAGLFLIGLFRQRKREDSV